MAFLFVSLNYTNGASKTFAIDYVVETFGYICSIIGILTATIVVGKSTYFIK